MTAVYVWYPKRFSAKDAFRIGNYNLLAYMGGNVALEFFIIPSALAMHFHPCNSNISSIRVPGR